jgi:RNA polymerase sigma factor (sigma-70 family)
MAISGSITAWIQQLKEGDRRAMQHLWERYFERLVTLARDKLQGLPRHVVDEEDVALSALKSFCRAVEQKRFPKLEDSGDLWQILVLLTRNKAADLHKYHRRARRDFRKVQPLLPLTADPPDVPGGVFIDLIRDEEPDPQFAAEAAEQYQRMLGLLPDEQLRQIAVGKMEGYTNEELAEQLGCATVTIERRLNRIRQCWASLLPP